MSFSQNKVSLGIKTEHQHDNIGNPKRRTLLYSFQGSSIWAEELILHIFEE
ncbi:hypothetical protein BB560_006951 [Smittium megazygosporum]|uniref:Uncharacterized protein n=1 Tax=Smittium megazygosporum TaxID=133381 RepID=A0A2T9Y074_9FUNG|nr:hypothetical protein BB560_006951 [Smittium megazygosporum]